MKFGMLTHISRSGSTLLARMLDDFEHICVTTEAELPLELFGVKAYTPIHFATENAIVSYFDLLLSKTRVITWKLSKESLLSRCELQGYPISGPAFVKILLSLYGETYKPKAKMVIYKACPFMPWHIPESIEHFPDAKFLHIIRDPRAVFHSQLNSLDPFTGKPFSKSALKTAMDWEKATSLDKSFIKSHIFEIKYESLLSEPEIILHGLIQYLGIENQTKTGNSSSFASRMEEADKNLHAGISSEPDPEKISVWEKTLSKKNIVLLETFFGDRLLEKGYEKSAAAINHPVFYRNYVFFGIRFQIVKYFVKRIARVIKASLSNPMYLLRKTILKIHNG